MVGWDYRGDNAAANRRRRKAISYPSAEILDFLKQKEINQKGIVRFTERQIYDFFKEKKSFYDINDQKEKLLWQTYLDLERIFNELISQGKCLVADGKQGEKIGRISVLFWNWIGCGGKCRQYGRIFCTLDYKTVISRTADLYED